MYIRNERILKLMESKIREENINVDGGSWMLKRTKLKLGFARMSYLYAVRR